MKQLQLLHERHVALADSVPSAVGLTHAREFTTIMKDFKKSSLWRQALGMMADMRKQVVQVNVITYSVAISACEKGAQWQSALNLLREMELCSVDANVITYNAAISAMARGEQWQQALGLLVEMKRGIVDPVVITYSAAMSACAKAEQWPWALRLLTEMHQRGLLLDMISLSTAISACEKGGRWEMALGKLVDMERQQLEPNVITYNSAISACDKGEQWDLALGLLVGMDPQGLKPDTIGYSAVVAACARCAQWERALEVAADMSKDNLKHDAISYRALIGACERAENWAWALALFEEMRTRSIETNGMDYGAVISIAKSTGQWLAARMLLSQARTTWIAADKRHRIVDGNTVVDSGGASLLPSTHVEIVCERQGIVAVSKPSGVSTDDLLDQLRSQLQAKGRKGLVKCVSRLDFPTSGVLVAGLGSEASAPSQWLMTQFAGHCVSKDYLCLCKCMDPLGSLSIVESCLGMKAVGDDNYLAFVSTNGKHACTQFEILGTYVMDRTPDASSEQAFSLVLAKPRTGRTHQIRAHLASIGRPLVSDSTYDPDKYRNELLWCPRTFLHCRRTALQDLEGDEFVAQAALPIDLASIFGFLRCKDDAAIEAHRCMDNG